jgi:deoxyribodipyrimidine photo-lyase
MTATPPAKRCHIVWFRDDLRVADNPALVGAINGADTLLCVYCLDTGSGAARKPGAAARWWLDGSLKALDTELRALGNRLVLLEGDPGQRLAELARVMPASAVFWNRRYEAGAVAEDREVKARLVEMGVDARSHNGALLREPWTVKTRSGDPFRVFTPFWREAAARGDWPAAAPAPQTLPPPPTDRAAAGVTLASLALKPNRPNWARGFESRWQPGASGARARMSDFIAGGFRGYAEERNRPDRESTSRLSPHLRFGDISPRQVLQTARAATADGAAPESDFEKFASEIGWREFAYHLLYHNPDLAQVPFQARFAAFPWREDEGAFAAWRRGRTGYPIVDAGMRQLWQTGWMHNRVRMIVASFLVKHLLIDWRHGESWFWDTLVDADAANNPASWQWVAGCGADAAPYFRIFNPTLQGEKFDPDGNYVRTFVPELRALPATLIHRPWQARPIDLAATGIKLDIDYPAPIVDHDMARRRALAAFAALSDRQAEA